MKKEPSKNEDIILNILGVLFLFWGVMAIANSLYVLNPNQIFWNCYIGLLLIGIGILSRNSKLIGSQLVILGIPLIFWDIDFIYYVFTKESLWGITNYFFLERTLNVGKIISLQHLFTLPLGIYAMSAIKVKKFDFWKVSTVQLALLFVIISLLTEPLHNIGCVFKNCMSVEISLISGIPWNVMWFVGFFGMVFISNFILYNLRFLRHSKIERGMF